MRGLGVQELPVPEVATVCQQNPHGILFKNLLVCGLSLRHLIVRLWFASMNDIRKPYRILDEEDRDIVAHDIPITFLGVELDGKPANVSDRICATTTS